MIEGQAREDDGVNNIGLACGNYPDPSLVTHPVVLELLDSISQIHVALTNDVTALRHFDCPPV